MLCLSKTDILEAVTLEDILMAVESALLTYEKKEFHMPLRMHVEYEGNTLLLMPSFVPGHFGTKLVSLSPGNARRNEPVLKGVMVLNDGESGEPLALLNAAALTALRTGAVGGTGIRYLAPPDVDTLGIVGAGVQGYHQALFATEVRDFADVLVYDLDTDGISNFVRKLSAERPDVGVRATGSVEELLEKSQVIIASTSAREPVLPDNEEALKGKHFVGIGSYKPGMREFPASLFRLVDSVYVDTEHAVEETGDLVDPLKNGWISREQVITLGKRISLAKEGKAPVHAISFFKSVGMALFDLVVSEVIYRKALEQDLGQKVSL